MKYMVYYCYDSSVFQLLDRASVSRQQDFLVDLLVSARTASYNAITEKAAYPGGQGYSLGIVRRFSCYDGGRCGRPPYQ